MTPAERNHLVALHSALVQLHKLLLDSERVGYERTFGPVASPNDFLRLLINDPWFGWLQPISSLIVAMDEALDVKTRRPTTNAVELIERTRTLLVASEIGEGFSKHYDNALQRDPDVVMGHADVMRLLRGSSQPA